jgi:CRISPR-associated endonuclease/helicase Cas3
MTPDEPYLQLWGKTDRRPNGDRMNYHPLLFHLFDVAFCAEALWKTLPGSIKTRMADALGLDTEHAGTLFTLLAGLHDLGKAYPKFQFQSSAEQFQAALSVAGFDLPADICVHPHNFVSVPEVERLFEEAHLLQSPPTPALARVFAYALGAHHGVFPQTADLTSIQGRVLGVNPQWQAARNWLAEQLKAAIPNVEEAGLPVNRAAVQDYAFAPLLAALISLADWFGSSNHFEMHGKQNIDLYRQTSAKSATDALKMSGWTAPPTPPEPPDDADFARMFAYLKDKAAVEPIEPNDLQRTVMALLTEVSGPALWIIEEEMGAGKTETAFAIFDYARNHKRTKCNSSNDNAAKDIYIAHGVYIAMPTQATSNAMYDRLSAFLTNRNPREDINLILAHSHATLDKDYLERMKIAAAFNQAVYSDEANTEEGTLLVQSWFTHSKQTLLAHYGVGTIDQALMGVLQTRHWFVRLFGLAGKVVVFDEVHAYDAYMNTLLAQLIGWLAELDCTVVLLSATLPTATRLLLADAYAKGAKARLKEADNQPAYPRITLVQKGLPASARAVTIENTQKLEPRHIALAHLRNTSAAVKAALLEAIPEQGCAIVICNTVAGAQQMYAALKAELASEWECLLFHARTPFKWRQEKEKQVLRLFDKHSGADGAVPRKKTLLVATQVVEQSLDLDADFMASELAPVDLILQRMGRLWRHKNRARTAPEAHFALLYDVDANTGLPAFGSSEYIYAPHTLLRSWLALKDRHEIILPADIEFLVREVYDLPDPTDLADGLTQRLADASEKLKEKRKQQRDHAKKVSVTIQQEGSTFTDWVSGLAPTLLDDEDPEIHNTLRALTRDGDPSLTVVLCGTDKNGASLAPQPAGIIFPETAQQMMAFSLSLSSKAIYFPLVSEQPPDNWQKNAHLKHCRRIVFENGIASVGNRSLTLTKESGLVIEKDQGE